MAAAVTSGSFPAGAGSSNGAGMEVDAAGKVEGAWAGEGCPAYSWTYPVFFPRSGAGSDGLGRDGQRVGGAAPARHPQHQRPLDPDALAGGASRPRSGWGRPVWQEGLRAPGAEGRPPHAANETSPPASLLPGSAVIGALIGRQEGRNIEVMNSFELLSHTVEENVVIDKEYYYTKEEQCK